MDGDSVARELQELRGRVEALSGRVEEAREDLSGRIQSVRERLESLAGELRLETRDVAALTRAVFGNGRPEAALTERTRNLEEASRREREQLEEVLASIRSRSRSAAKARAQLLATIISSLAAIVAAALALFR